MVSKNIFVNIDLDGRVKGYENALIPVDAHHRLVKHYSSPLLLGPEPSDALLALVMHMFSAEEAELAQHLYPLRPKRAEKVARSSGRPEKEVKAILEHLSSKKRVLLSYGDPPKYTILPIVPGTFEMALMTPEPGSRNVWHRTFAELFEKIWDEGYIVDYMKRINSNVRYLPVNGVAESLYSAWPSDRLEEQLDCYDDFAVGMCQCRMAMEFTGEGCGRPLETCVTMGSSALNMISRGMMRRAEPEEIIEIKRNAENQGCVSWMMNTPGGVHKGNTSCSCCGCCCHFMKSITQFNAPGIVSKPNFHPVCDISLCINCGKCSSSCPMSAWKLEGGIPVLDSARCIGCGLCVLACPRGAITLKPVDGDPHEPGWLKYLMDIIPGYVMNSFGIWIKRALR